MWNAAPPTDMIRHVTTEPITTAADVWRSRPMASWRARLAVMASRGEIGGPRVDECRAALSNWRLYTFLTKECGRTEFDADAMIDAALAALPAPGRVP